MAPDAARADRLYCELTATGVPEFALTRDYADRYHWVVTTALVQSSEPFLGGYPAELEGPLDELTRSLDRDGRLKGISLIWMGWALPPPADGWVLHYSDGNEEGGIDLLVTVDREAHRILSMVPLGG